MTEVDLKDATVSVLIEVDGIVHLVTMKKERYEAISFVAKQAACGLVKTKRTQNELYDFLEVQK